MYICIQNKVALTAVKVTPNKNIKAIHPLKRNCYFVDEHPLNQPLKAYNKYSQVKLSNII